MIGSWKEQYHRMRRSLLKAQGPHANTDVLADDLYHFFQDCLHLKDWIKNDSSAPSTMRDNVESWVENSTPLKLAADIANATKHLTLTNRRRGGAEIVGADVSIELAAETKITAQHRVQTDAGAGYIRAGGPKNLPRSAVREVAQQIAAAHPNKDTLTEGATLLVEFTQRLEAMLANYRDGAA